MPTYLDILDMLVCPRAKAQGRIAPLSAGKDGLRGPLKTYPVLEDVPDLRVDDLGDTSYDTIHVQKALRNKLEAMSDRMDALVESLGMRAEEINGKDVLLAGAGAGVELALLSRFDPKRIVAIDFSGHIRALKSNAELFHPRTIFLQGDLCNLPFAGQTFDYVINSGVMHHTRSPELAFRELHGVLRPGGVIVMGHIYTPNDHNRKITMGRNRHGFHLMDRDKALKIMHSQAARYTWACRHGLLKHLKKYPRLFGMHIEMSGRCITDFETNLTSACDYYLCEYRHTITPEEVLSWYDHVGMQAHLTAKGYYGKKPS